MYSQDQSARLNVGIYIYNAPLGTRLAEKWVDGRNYCDNYCMSCDCVTAVLWISYAAVLLLEQWLLK